MLTQGEPLLDFPHPLTHKVVEMGGLGIPDVRPLDKVPFQFGGNFMVCHQEKNQDCGNVLQ